MSQPRDRSAPGPKLPLALGLIVLLTISSFGCASTPRQTGLMRQTPEVEARAGELRIRIRAYAHRFAHVIEEAADVITLRSDDTDVQRAALEWKSKAIAQAQTSCFHSDPMAALFDTWAFAIQQRIYFQDPIASGRFGDWRPVGLEAAETVELEVREIVRGIKRDGDISKSRAYVEEWAYANPVEGEWLRRRSILPKLAEALASENLGTLARLGRLSEDLSDLSMRASLYNEMLPKQSRWQAELLAYEMGMVELQETVLETIPQLTEIAERAVAQVEALPDVVHREREAALAQLQAELTRAMEQISRERESILEEMDRMVAAQWATMRDDLPELTGATVAQTQESFEEVIDHAILRVAQVGGAGLILAFLLGLALIRLAR